MEQKRADRGSAAGTSGHGDGEAAPLPLPDVSRETRRNTEARLHCVIYGSVQGVGFRYFVLRAARRLHLSGYTRNRPDGTVEVEAAGPADALVELRHTVENGPPQAHVTRVESLEPSAQALPEPFEIVR